MPDHAASSQLLFNAAINMNAQGLITTTSRIRDFNLMPIEKRYFQPSQGPHGLEQATSKKNALNKTNQRFQRKNFFFSLDKSRKQL